MSHDLSGRAATAEAPEIAGPGGAWVRAGVWAFHLALPVLGLWLLVERPHLDALWEHHPSHFWLVMSVAGVNALLGLRVSQAARIRSDPRLFFVGLSFFAAAGFLFLHALATPGVLLTDKNTGFVVATPVGLFVAGVLAALSSLEFPAERAAAVMRNQRILRAGLVAVVVGWAAASLLEGPLLGAPPNEKEVHGPLVVLAFACVGLFAIAAVRYFRLQRRRPAVMLVGLITAFALLAEAMVAIVFARSWHLSWWEWHLLMAIGFAFVAYSAYVQYTREGSAAGLFDGIAVDETVKRIRAEYGAALEALTSAMLRYEQRGWTEQELDLLTAGLASRFGLSEGQTGVLSRAAGALAAEREQSRGLAALAELGRESRVMLGEEELLRRVVEIARGGFERDDMRIGLVRRGELEFPAELTSGGETSWAAGPDPATLALPLTLKGRRAGVIEIRRRVGTFSDNDRALLASLASQLSIALENARLYAQIDELFRRYMSPDVASTLLADPAQAELGGAMFELTVLFADLRGFTTFTEKFGPQDVITMLNRYFGVAVPCVLDNGGTVVQFVGDAMMAVFNAPARQPDHPLLAARAGLALQHSIEEISAQNPSWPRFRVGICTGPALVGNVGSDRFRSFGVMGDTVNTAARLQAIASPGQVVISDSTLRSIGRVAEVEPLGNLDLKGKTKPVGAYVLRALDEHHVPA